MYQLIPTNQFKKDLKKTKQKPKDFHLVSQLLRVLQAKGRAGIPRAMNPHQLKGVNKDNWECHIKPDLLIIWYQIESPQRIKLIRLGSHSDLFK